MKKLRVFAATQKQSLKPKPYRPLIFPYSSLLLNTGKKNNANKGQSVQKLLRITEYDDEIKKLW